jgi:hypothetical protein
MTSWLAADGKTANLFYSVATVLNGWMYSRNSVVVVIFERIAAHRWVPSSQHGPPARFNLKEKGEGLKGPKLQIFVSGVFTHIRTVWEGVL